MANKAAFQHHGVHDVGRVPELDRFDGFGGRGCVHEMRPVKEAENVMICAGFPGCRNARKARASLKKKLGKKRKSADKFADLFLRSDQTDREIFQRLARQRTDGA